MGPLRKNYILQALAVLAVIYLVIDLRYVATIIFLSFIFTVVMNPVVSYMKRHKVPTALAVLTPIVIALAAIGLIAYFIIPTFAQQITLFANKVPHYINVLKNRHIINPKTNVSSLGNIVQSHFNTLSSKLLSYSLSVLKILTGLLSIFIISVYWVSTYPKTRKTLLSFFPTSARSRATDILTRMEHKIVSWLRAQVLVSFAVGAMVYIGATIIHLPFAGLLGLVAGLLEIVPTLGPIASAIPGILLGLTVSPEKAIVALVMYIIIDQLEAHILSPWLLGHSVKLHPAIIIIALLTGAELYGIVGTLIAVPVSLCISAVVDSFRNEPINPPPKKWLKWISAGPVDPGSDSPN